ncbi:hypothetical protein ACQ27_gp411 [Klebsiella phage K64-1]|nr:hypothetical protein ACQ27_gp411 [Klebsiella phage K64-1]
MKIDPVLGVGIPLKRPITHYKRFL